MYLLGHLGLALLVASPVAFVAVRAGRTRATWSCLTVLLCSVMLPDVDAHVASLTHRGLTHTVWTALVLGCLFAVVTSSLGPRVRESRLEAVTLGFGVGATSVVSHLLGDVITPMGIRPFAPVSGAEYSLALVAARNPAANLALFVAGVVAFGLAYGWGRAGATAPEPTADAPVSSTDAGETSAAVAPDASGDRPVSGD